MINGGDSTLLSLNPSVEVGPFTTNGNPKQVSYGIRWSGNSSQDGYCPANSFTPSCTLILERSVGGSGWTQVQTHSVTGNMEFNELHEPELSSDPSGRICNRFESTSASFTYTDTTPGLGNFLYRVRVTNQQRYHVTQFINFQRVNLISVEERPS